MGINVGTAYVELVPTAQGFIAKVKQELGNDLPETGKDAGKDAGSGFMDSFKVAAVAGVAIVGATLAKGLSDAMGAEVSNDKLAAQLGLNNQQAESFGRAAGELYSNAYGDSLEGVNDALRAVSQNIGEGIGPADDALKTVTAGVLDLGTAFEGADLERTTAAIGQMIKTGLAPDAQAAMDILTVGFQQGNDKAGDLLDTFNEYGTQFRKLGIDGTTAMGLISQGLQAGARDSDIVADAIKEFSIRAIDGSKLTAEGFATLGLNAEEMQARFAAGGPEAAKGLDKVLTGLRSLTDPAARSAAAVALFGTQAEDMGEALFALDPSTAAEGLGEVAGATEKLGETLADNNATKIEMFKRQALQGIANFVAQYVIPAMEKLGPILQDFGAKLGSVIDFLRNNQPILIGVGAVIATLLVSAFISWAAAAGAAAIATLTAMAPVIAIGVAIGVLVVGIIWAYQNFDWFREAVNAVGRALQAAWEWVRDNWPLLLAILTGPIGIAVAIIMRNWDTIKDGARAVKDWIVDRFNDIVGFITGIPGRVSGALSSVFNPIRDAAAGAVQWVADRVGDIVNWITGIPGRVGNVFGGMFDGISGAMRSAVNAVAGLWNRTVGRLSFQIPGWVPGIGGNGWDVPDIPMLAAGGIALHSTLAVIGEAGPEAVIPLRQLPEIANRMVSQSPVSGASSIRGDTYLTINQTGLADPMATADEVAFRLKTIGR